MTDRLPAHMQIPVGVVVERRKSSSPWVDHIWCPVAVLPGVPEAGAWTRLKEEPEVASFYAGDVQIELVHSHTQFYRDNLASGTPSLWVVMYPSEGEWPYKIAAVTADPAEGESYSETGANLVEMVPMPDAIRDVVAAFVDEHHVEQVFYKRKRDRANTEAMGRRGPIREDRK